MIANAINKGGRVAVAVHGSKIVNCDKFGHKNPNSASSNTNQVPFFSVLVSRISKVVVKVSEVVGKVIEDVGNASGLGYRGTQRGQGAWNNEQGCQ
ncbi:hypothetical protein DPMN_012471 [Dreissena polymorpha]|uniref:Uncharacterized protein n=1 Tax=Dreissena polymorpha TaxID=45954 RepID=A0A9D4S1E1_DREPO|nr:hypothetical protein DPMN_012471 [Dreissena polymorpha]